MPESQENVDSLLAEVSALADEAVADVVGDEQPSAPADAGLPADVPEKAGGPAEAGAHQGIAAAPAPPSAPAKPSQPGSDQRQEDAARILRLQVPVIVRLAETFMPVSEITSLSTGAIIEFDKPSDSELDLMINNKCIGQGLAVKVGENFGLRVTTIGCLHERIKAMGDQ